MAIRNGDLMSSSNTFCWWHQTACRPPGGVKLRINHLVAHYFKHSIVVNRLDMALRISNDLNY